MMPWDKNDYPDSLKNFDEATRNKAIEIANAMVEEGYDEGRAIPIATDQAKEWADGASEKEKKEMKNISDSKLTDHDSNENDTNTDLLDNDVLVKPHEDGWAVQTAGAEQAAKVYDKKNEAVDRAKEMAENKESKVIVQDRDGNKQDTISFNE